MVRLLLFLKSIRIVAMIETKTILANIEHDFKEELDYALSSYFQCRCSWGCRIKKRKESIFQKLKGKLMKL